MIKTVTGVKQSDVSYADNTKTAYRSDFKNEAITLGDGEKLTLKFNVAESKLAGLKITVKLQNKKNANIVLANEATTGQFILSHKSDQKQAAYKITAGYKPTYKRKASYPDGTPIKLSDFVANTRTDSDSYKDWASPFTYDTHYDRRGWWTVNNTATSSRVYEFDSGWIHSDTRTVTEDNKGGKNDDWGRVRDTSLDGKCMSVSDFQSCVWYYIPSFHVHKYYPIYLEVRNSACTTR